MSATMSWPAAGLHWYLVHCKPREDARALEHLERQQFHCYRPMQISEVLRDGHWYRRSEPLFPRYLFVRLDCARDSWYAIRSTRGVHQIVQFNSYPLPVRDEIVDGIRARLAAPAVREPCLRPGERVQITEGAFSEFEAIFVANEGGQRVVLLLNVLQHDQRLIFPMRSVRKIG